MDIKILGVKYKNAEIESELISLPKDLFHYSINHDGDYSIFTIDMDNLDLDFNDITSFMINTVKTWYLTYPYDDIKWIINTKEFDIEDKEVIRRIYLDSRMNEPEYRKINFTLNNIINDNNIKTIEELRSYCDKPFSEIIPMNSLDYNKLLGDMEIWTGKVTPRNYGYYEKEYVGDIYIFNRYIKDSFKFIHGEKVHLINCIVEGNINLVSVKDVCIDNCIIIGEFRTIDASRVHALSSRFGAFNIYGDNICDYYFSHNKVYNFTIGGKINKRAFIWENNIENIAMANLELPEPYKLEMSQINFKSINEKTISNMIDGQMPIDAEDSFYLTDIGAENRKDNEKGHGVPNYLSVLSMLSNIEKNGNVENYTSLKANIEYTRALCLNRGIKRALVFWSGGFVKPYVWLIHLLIFTAIFTGIYLCPGIYFDMPIVEEGIVTITKVSLDLKSSICYSLSQLVISNPMNFEPHGITTIVSSIQGLINAFLFANLVATIWKRYMIKAD